MDRYSLDLISCLFFLVFFVHGLECPIEEGTLQPRLFFVGSCCHRAMKSVHSLFFGRLKGAQKKSEFVSKIGPVS